MRQRIILILLLLSVLNIASQNAILEGKMIVTNPEDIEIVKNELEVYLTSCGPDKMIDVGDDLTFKFENLQPGEYELLFFPNGDTDYLNRNINIDPGENTVRINVEYFYNCKYNVSKNNKTCPKCKKSNRVVPVTHGFLSYDNKSFSLGCLIVSDCEPNWFCKRDKLLF